MVARNFKVPLNSRLGPIARIELHDGMLTCLAIRTSLWRALNFPSQAEPKSKDLFLFRLEKLAELRRGNRQEQLALSHAHVFAQDWQLSNQLLISHLPCEKFDSFVDLPPSSNFQESVHNSINHMLCSINNLKAGLYLALDDESILPGLENDFKKMVQLQDLLWSNPPLKSTMQAAKRASMPALAPFSLCESTDDPPLLTHLFSHEAQASIPVKPFFQDEDIPINLVKELDAVLARRDHLFSA